MRGTEKQIKWATEIQSNVVNTFEHMIPVIPTIAPSQTAAESAAKKIRGCIDRLKAEDVCAGDIIELFKDIRFSGDLKHDFNAVMAVYSNTVPYTTTARALLGR